MMDARESALRVLRRVHTEGAFAHVALRHELDELTRSEDRGLATELVYGVLRRRRHLDLMLRQVSRKRLKDFHPRIHDALRVGMFQIACLERIPDHAVVHSLVEWSKHHAGERPAKTVNAVLRKATEMSWRDWAAPLDATQPQSTQLAIAGSVGNDVAEAFVHLLGAAHTERLLTACLASAPLTLRANLRVTTQAELAQEVGGTEGQSPEAVVLPHRGQLPQDMNAVLEGRATVQDEASMRVTHALELKPGMQVLDLCAAPGGKTTHIAEQMNDQGSITAHDRFPKKLRFIEAHAERLGLRSIKTQAFLPEPSEKFDRILVDAPCTGLGTLRRHPEIRWRFKKEDIDACRRVQEQVLKEAAERLRPDGRIVYSICSLTQAEGPGHTAWIEHLGLRVVRTEMSSPDAPGAPDGFFAAVLEPA